MAPPVRQTGTTLTGASAASAVVTLPAGIAAGDVVIVSLYKENTAAVTPPAGYTEKPASGPTTTAPQAQHTFWHRASGSESGTVTFSWTGSVFRAATADRISGCISSGDPIEGAPAANSSNASVTTLNVSLAATSTDTLLYWAGTNFAGGNTWTPPAGYTEQADIDVLSCATKTNAAGGATGNVTGTANVSGATTAVLLDLLPGAAAAGATPAPLVVPQAAVMRAANW